MIDEQLASVLIKQKLVSADELESAKQMIENGDDRKLGSILVGMDAIQRSKLIRVIAEFINLPIAKNKLKELEKKREDKNKNLISSGIDSNVSPFVLDDKKVNEDLYFYDGNIKIDGPKLDISEFDDCKMDELQVAQMTLMLLDDEQWEETEAYLIEAVSDFPDSVILRYQLIWLYNATGYQQKAIEHSREVEKHENLQLAVYEIVAWTMLKNLKFLEAVRLYQILCKQNDVQSLWFYLLGLCLFKSNLHNQAVKVFKHYLTLDDLPKDLTNNAEFYLDQIKD